ncbi:MAG TPA: GNAT family N-acetyltransferase [Luteimonas sp.]
MREPELLTTSLRLRLVGEGDAALYRALYTCPRVMAQIGPPLTREEADDAFDRVCAHNRTPDSLHRAWSIRGRSDDAPHGLLALRREGNDAEIGLMLLPRAWMPAVSRESIAAALAYGFEHAGLESIWADCLDGPNSRALRRLLEPFGFARIDPRRPRHAAWRIGRPAWETRGSAHAVALVAP